MSLPVKTGFPDNMSLTDGYVVRFTAVDAATGAVVTGVQISHASLLVQATSATGLESGAFKPVLLRTSVASAP